MVEQLIRNQQVGGSNPLVSFFHFTGIHRYQNSMNKILQDNLLSSLLSSFLILLFVLVLYFPILDGPFKTVYDTDHIVDNASLKSTDNISRILTGNIFRTDIPYRPVAALSHMAEMQTFGSSPLFYYLTNILLHAGCALLVFSFIALLTGNRLTGFLTALVFAVHPVHWEAVSFLSGRAVLLNTFFNLTALWACLLYMRRLNGWWMCLSVAAFAAALLSLDLYLSVLVVFLFYFLCVKSDQLSKSVRLIVFLPYAVLWVMFILIRHGINGFSLPLAVDIADFVFRLMAAARIIFVELTILLAPVHIHFHQTADSLQSWDDPKAIIVLALMIVGLMTLYIRRNKTRGFVVFLTVWFLAALWPLLKVAFMTGSRHNLLPVDGTMSYMASIPLIALAVLFLQKVLSHIPKNRLAGGFIAAVAVVAFSFLTFKQNVLSTSEIALLNHAKIYEPDSAIIDYDLGLVYGKGQNYAQAESHFEQAIALDENFTSAYMGLGKVLFEQGKLLEAAKAYEAIKFPGRYASVLQRNLRGIYSVLIANQEAVLVTSPNDINAYFSLGVFYDKMGDVNRAIAAYQQVIELDPKNQEGLTEPALKFQGQIFERLGQTGKAQQNFSRMGANTSQPISINIGNI